MSVTSPQATSPTAVEAVGVFLATNDVPRLIAWYRALGVPLGDEGYCAIGGADPNSGSVFSIMEAAKVLPDNARDLKEEPYGLRRVTLNLRVRGLTRMLDDLRKKGTPVVGPRDHGYGVFAWVQDPDGNILELWEPGSSP